MRLIMFRPVLSALFNSGYTDAKCEPDNSIESAMQEGMLDKGVNLCASAACELVDLIAGNLSASNNFLPPPWFNVFCTCFPHIHHLLSVAYVHVLVDMHSCAIVFLICRLGCLNRIQDRDALERGWNKCQAFFRTYQSRSRSARRCLKLMETMQMEVFHSRNCGFSSYMGGKTPIDL